MTIEKQDEGAFDALLIWTGAFVAGGILSPALALIFGQLIHVVPKTYAMEMGILLGIIVWIILGVKIGKVGSAKQSSSIAWITGFLVSSLITFVITIW